MLIQIKNIRIVDPACKVDKVGDIFIENGKIVDKLSAKPEKIIDGYFYSTIVDVNVIIVAFKANP